MLKMVLRNNLFDDSDYLSTFDLNYGFENNKRFCLLA